MGIIKGKKFGIGTLSLVMSIVGIYILVNKLEGWDIISYILGIAGIPLKNRIVAVGLFSISIFIGHKYNKDYCAKAGKLLSIIFIAIIVKTLILTCIMLIIFIIIGFIGISM